MKPPSVLVLLSTYNGEKYLPELLDSLKKQKGVDLSLLVRDDGSKDDTIQVVKEHFPEHCQIIEGENCGSTKSFFALMKEASLDYDYYAFCDQDDSWMEDKLSRAVSCLSSLSEKEKPQLYFAGQVLTDADLHIIGEHKISFSGDVRSGVIFNQMAGCTTLFNKALLQLFKRHPDVNAAFHDSYLYKLCVAFDGDIYVDDQEKILYRQHGTNTVGLTYSLSGKLRLLKQHWNAKDCGLEVSEIIRAYGKEIPDKYRNFFEDIANSKTDKQARKRLLKANIDFGSKAKKMLFKAKARKGRL